MKYKGQWVLWSKHTKKVVKRARQCLFPLRRLKRFGMGPQILKKFHSCTIESIQTGCITAWYGNCLVSDRKELQRGVRKAQYITGPKLPAIQDLYTRGKRNGQKIVNDSSYPSHRLFSLLTHGKRYRSAKSRSKRLLNSFYPLSHKTTEHLIKWLHRLFALTHPPYFTVLLVSVVIIYV